MDEIEVPCHFLCPISLQLMKDPVTVSTGISYERHNIERWLFSCKNKNTTCPVTNQVIILEHGHLDLTPNHTLHRLIHSWCTLNASNGIDPIPTPKPPLTQTQIEKFIQDAKRSPHLQLNFLKRLKSITLENESNRSFLGCSGAVEFLVSIIKKVRVCPDIDDQCDDALSILYYLRISESQLKNLVTEGGEFLESLLQILKQGNYQSRAYSTMLLRSMFEIADPLQIISIRKELFSEMILVLRDQISQQASKAALKFLIEVCPWGRNRIKAVEGGAVGVLIELLLEISDKRATELILTVLDVLCGCAEGRAEMINHGAGLAVVSKKILRVSHVGSDRAVRILCTICKFCASFRVLQEMLQLGIVAKLCLVLQVETKIKTKERVMEMLKLHSRVWRNSPCIPPHLLSFYPS
ncbi:plant U-box 22 [Euphorbia peplus]|nr:plant U-box 22 [Euphorbia peplus]